MSRKGLFEIMKCQRMVDETKTPEEEKVKQMNDGKKMNVTTAFPSLLHIQSLVKYAILRTSVTHN